MYRDDSVFEKRIVVSVGIKCPHYGIVSYNKALFFVIGSFLSRYYLLDLQSRVRYVFEGERSRNSRFDILLYRFGVRFSRFLNPRPSF